MSAAVQATAIVPEDWKTEFLSFVSNRLDRIEKDYQMESMDDISKSLFENRSDIMGQAALALVDKKFGHLLNQQYCQCPHCLRRIKAKPEKVKREVQVLIGSVMLYRPYFYCNICHYGFYPLDEALGLSNRKIQPDIQELEAWLAAEMPYETACETLKRCAGLELSNHHIHDVTNEVTQDLEILDICPSKEEIRCKIDKISEGKFRRPILMIGIDGAHAPHPPRAIAKKRGKGQGRMERG